MTTSPRRGRHDATLDETPRPLSVDSREVAVSSGEQRRTIGPFVIQSELGRGGMGVVYRALGPNGESRAVKVLARRADDKLIERFQREAGIRIEHPNVVKVFDAGTDLDGTMYIAFELLEGESLSHRLSSGRMSPKEAVEIGVQICSGLSAAHAVGIVHRDLKPANLFITREGVLKILDFGIAFFAAEDVRLTRTGVVVGTPTYLSPEQARGDSSIDPRADLWALGTVLYEALAGRPPHHRETPLATMIAVVMESFAPLSDVAADVPLELSQAIERALQKTREDRWPTAESFARALRAADLTPPRGRVPMRPREDTPITAGERRIVSLMLAAGVRDLLRVRAAIVERGGTMVPLAGQRALGIFGGSRSEGDELSRAADVALELQPVCEQIAISVGHAFSARGGISGRAVKDAEMLLVREHPGIALAPDAAVLLGESFELREDVRGFYTLVDRKPDAIQPTRPLVGRDAELAQLRQALNTVLFEERALAVHVSGPPGIGKTRLREELHNILGIAAPESRFTTLLLRAAPHRRLSALSIFAANLGADRAKLETMARWAIVDPDRVKETLPFLFELAGIEGEETEALRAARQDARLMSDRLRLAVRELFAGLSARGPLALLIDDLQWADDASLALLEEIYEHLSDRPVLFFYTARPDFLETHREFLASAEPLLIEPRGLMSSDIAALARSLVKRNLDKTLVRKISERTGGNPLFVEHIVLELFDRGSLDTPVESLPMPLTVEAAVQSRLDHLPPDEKELLKHAALVRRPFYSEEVAALGGANVELCLASLMKRDLVSSRASERQRDKRRYRVKSALVADVAYLLIAAEVRRDLHRRMARYLAVAPRQPKEEVAIHFERAEMVAEAAKYFAQAAYDAAHRGDSPSVLRCADRALALGVAREEHWALYIVKSDALAFLGRRDEQYTAIEAASFAAKSEGERARALAERSWWSANAGKHEEAIAFADRAVLSARQAQDREALARALGRKTVASIYCGRLEDARAALNEAAKLAAGSPVLAALAEGWRAQLASATGDLGERRDAFRAAMFNYAKVGDVRSAAGAETNLADVYNRVGAYADAEAALLRALEGCRRVGHRLMEGYAQLNLAYARVQLDRVEEARESLAAAEEIARFTKNARLLAWVAIYRARADLSDRLRSPDSMVRSAEGAVAEAQRSGLPAQTVMARGIAARACLRAGDATRALAHAEDAVKLRDQLGGVEEDEAELYLALEAAARACGREDEAARAHANGRAIVEATAAKIVDPDLQARYRAVPAHSALLK